MSELKIRLENAEEYHELINALAENMPDQSFVLPEIGGRNSGISIDHDNGFKRVADFVFPAEIFSSSETRDDIAAADKRLLAPGLIPNEYLDTDADCVVSYDDLHEMADAAAESVDGDAAFLIGGFSPNGNWNMTGNPDNNKPRKLSAMHFPERAFDTATACEPLQKVHTGLLGTLVMPQSAFTDESLAFMRGERDRLPIEERDTGPSPEEINEQLRGLSPGDMVTVNNRSRALRVIPNDETRRIGWSSGETMFLKGNGTVYRLHIKDGKYPKMDWSSDRVSVTEVEIDEQTKQEVPADD